MHVFAHNMVAVFDRIANLNSNQLQYLNSLQPPIIDNLTVYCLAKLLNNIDGNITELSERLISVLDNLNLKE